MSDDLATLERTNDGGLIYFERTYSNTIDDVWGALTEPERLADWWPPFATNVHVDLRVGGVMSFDWPDGPQLEFKFTQIEAPTLLEHTHTTPGSWMRYDLEPTGNGTRLRATYFLPEPDLAIERGDIVGGHYGFDRLGAALAGEPIPFDMDKLIALQRRYAAEGLASAPQNGE
jgi:uncharacterized protein YndB with AHSA1/START domain